MTSFLDLLSNIRNTPNPLRPAFGNSYDKFPKAISKWVDTLPPQQTQTDVLRCSGMYDLCPREFVLNYWNPVGGKSFGFTSQMLMGIGTHLHSYLQNVVLGPLGILEGTWHREPESHFELIEGYHPMGEEQIYSYSKGGSQGWQYVEPVVYDDVYRLSGHCDGIICKDRFTKFIELSMLNLGWRDLLKELTKIPAGEKILLEIKTTSDRVFNGVNSAEDIAPYYKMQAACYQKLTGVKETLFWYFNRGDCSSKLFSYVAEDTWWKEVNRKAIIIWEAIRDKTLPDSMKKCLTPKDDRAKSCLHSGNCWEKSLDFAKFCATMMEQQPKRAWLDLSAWKPRLEDVEVECLI